MAFEGPENQPVQAVREELRRLGYFDSGLDRFVLGGATGASGWRRSAGVALRVGVAGGVVFGVALAMLAASLDTRWLAAPADLAVLAVYLSAFTGVATGLIALCGGLVAGWAARRLGRGPGPQLSRNAGLALALGGLAYLALWWPSHAASAPLPMQVLFVGVGVLLAALLGRFGSLAAVAVLAAGGASDRLPPARLARRHMLPLSVAAVLLFGGGLATARYLAPRPEGAPAFAVVPTGLRVLLLGIDGLERGMAEKLMAGGEMPALAALSASGARAGLIAEPERVPAIVWTTIATGRGPRAHGILSAGSRRLAGMTTPVLGGNGGLGGTLARAVELLRIARTEPASAPLRGAKAFWTVASEKGLAVGVVNWWASWPAEGVNGFLVSERAFYKLEKGAPPDREVFPPEAFSRLAPLVEPHDAELARRLDRFHVGAAARLAAEAGPDLEAVYLNGLDVFTERRLGAADTSAGLAELDDRVAELREYHAFLDGLLGGLLARRGPSDVVIVVGDPGRLARRGNARPEGFLAMAGGPVLATDLGRASEKDIAPTVLHLLGLPVSGELEGRVLERALSPDFARRHPVRSVASYGGGRARPAESAFDPEMVEQLRSLGYIQ